MITDMPASLGVIRTDKARLTQILNYLVGNSLEFTLSGFIKVLAEVDHAENQVLLMVADSCKGLQEHKCEQIWKSFELANPSAGRPGMRHVSS
jgi:signal transduction histidine kinase